jgi:tetratricopeptide (TPR) repeat protein
MRNFIPLLLVSLLATMGCANKDRVISEAPVWASKQGRLDVRFELIRTMIHGERYREALALILTSRADGATDPRLDLLQGVCMARQGLFTEAEQMLSRAHNRMKRAPEPVHELGLLYADWGKANQAMDAFKMAVEYDKSRATDWNNLGFLLFSDKQYPEATSALRQAIVLDPTKDKYRVNLAFSLFGETKHPEALRVFKSVLSKADAHYNMGVAHELTGESEAAEAQYKLALNANPEHQSAQLAHKRLQTQPETSP